MQQKKPENLKMLLIKMKDTLDAKVKKPRKKISQTQQCFNARSVSRTYQPTKWERIELEKSISFGMTLRSRKE